MRKRKRTRKRGRRRRRITRRRRRWRRRKIVKIFQSKRSVFKSTIYFCSHYKDPKQVKDKIKLKQNCTTLSSLCFMLKYKSIFLYNIKMYL